MRNQAPMLFILTGERGSGKTAVCSRVVSTARKAGWRAAGLLTPGVIENGEKIAIDVLDLANGKRRKLATLRGREQSQIQTTHWTFVQQALAWGNRILKSAMPCDLLVIDEIGPLELLRGQGFTAALEILDSFSFAFTLVVIRPELLEMAHSRWKPDREFVVGSPDEAIAIADQISREFGI